MDDNFKCHIVKSLSDYGSLIKDISLNQNSKNNNILWFRGSSTGIYKLIPSGLRDLIPVKIHKLENQNIEENYHEDNDFIMYGLEIDSMLEEFKNRGKKLIEKNIPNNDFEWMFLAQHYGLPTRLLDWSENSLVSLYFSFPKGFTQKSLVFNEDDEKYFLEKGYSNKGAVVFIINPCEINETFGFGNKPINISKEHKKWKDYVHPTEFCNKDTSHPVCVYSTEIDKRIEAQEGHFTLFGSDVKPLEEYKEIKPLIHKVLIPYKYIVKIKNQLEKYINSTDIFPDLDTLAREICLKEKRHFDMVKKKGYYNVCELY